MEGVFGLAKLMIPQIPSLTNTAVWHTLGMTQAAAKWDLRTELTIQVLRHMMGGGGRSKPSPISKVQGVTLKDPGIKGKMWVAKTTINAPAPDEESLREAVFKAVDEMSDGNVQYTKPNLVDVEVEWTGFRPSARKKDPLPEISEKEKYQRLLAEPTRTSDTVILYFHGGAYYLCDPITHRAVTSRLAKESHGRVCSVRYRLAPQAAFPSQLLDAFMVYLSLLYPPNESMHDAIPANQIVFGGDSAGGNLVFALVQLILQLHRTSSGAPKVFFNGREVEVPLPAGATANSGWFDICRSMPSISTNFKYDYLPLPNHDDAVSRFPKEKIWPTNPPRGDLFCDLSLLDHPLASPLSAESWRGSPPLFLITGEEMLADEDKVVASRAAAQGVIVQYEEYEGMPHCFAMLLPYLSTSDRCFRSWGDFCRRCVEEPDGLKTNGTFIHAKTGKEETLQFSNLTELNLEKVKKFMQEAKRRRIEGFEKEGKTMAKAAL
ncbi:hypothetical protein M433DRAFT_186660 [Acidomyces richmondensis BFW]|nr:MAG: hypothetical protein FE78DRAFT_342417 [Acidomyces sp. 'richmondensis']KYG46749.1 hypothetical protein M433DRAFT_186660 [Acidomyces richmondensis BFW]